MADEELPPVVAVLQANIRDFIDGFETAKRMLNDIDGDEATATVDMNKTPFDEGATEVAGEMRAINDMVARPKIQPEIDMSAAEAAAKLGINAGAIYKALNAGTIPGYRFQGGFNDWGRTWRWRVPQATLDQLQQAVDAHGAAALESMLLGGFGGGGVGGVGGIGGGPMRGPSVPWKRYAAINTALAAWGSGGGGGGRGGILGFLGGLFGGGKGGGGGLLRNLLWGRGLFGMAGLGSLGSFAGLGAEHMLMTGVGLAGSAMGGLLGGGLLGLGSLGVMGVGMGTDMAGIGQAAGDIKSVVAAQNQLSQAVALYGPKSQQAAQAQAQLNYTMSGFSPVARAAVAQAANTVQQFKSLFDKFTGPAEKIGAQIITSALKTGEAFLPTIGKFAATNMGIMQKSLTSKGGLFPWLQSPTGGLGIFTDLEKEFTRNLPTAMHALTQFFELFVRTVDTASHYTGGFIKTLDRFFTKWNGIGFGKWQAEIGNLIGDFRMWWGLLKVIGQDIYQIFHADSSHNKLFPGYVSTSQMIVTNLTQMLKKLHAWLQSTTGQKTLHNVFAAHKKELEQLLQLLPMVVKTLGGVEMALAPVFTKALSSVLQVLLPVVKALTSFPGGAWLVGLGLIAGKLNVLAPLLSATFKSLKGIVKTAPAAEGGTAATNEAGAAGGMAGMGSKLLGVGALGAMGAVGGNALASFTEKSKQHQRLAHDITTAGGGIFGAGVGLLSVNPILGAITMIVGAVTIAVGEIINHWKGVYKFLDDIWHHIDTDARHWFGDFENFFKAIGHHIATDATHWSENVYKVLDGAWHHVDIDARHWFGDFENFFKDIGRDIGNIASNIWHTVSRFFQNMWRDVVRWVQNLWHDVVNFFHNLWNDVVKAVQAGINSVIFFFFLLPKKVLSTLGHWLGDMWNFGIELMKRLAGGITHMAGAVGGAIGNAIKGGLSHVPGGSWVAHHLAAGTNFAAGGMTLIGERGPELMYVPRGARVYTNSSPTTRAAMSGAQGGNSKVVINVAAQTNADPHEIGNEVSWVMSRHMAGIH